MKKFIAIVSIVLLFLSGCSTLNADMMSDEDIAMAWFRDNYPDEECDEVVVRDYIGGYQDGRMIRAVFLNDDEKIAISVINADWYREYAFK